LLASFSGDNSDDNIDDTTTTSTATADDDEGDDVDIAASNADIVVRFLVSFVVDARGAVMIGRRHSGLRVIVPPLATSHPTRFQCKLINPASKLSCLPALSEGEALAARVLDLGSTRLTFDRSVHINADVSALYHLGIVS